MMGNLSLAKWWRQQTVENMLKGMVQQQVLRTLEAAHQLHVD